MRIELKIGLWLNILNIFITKINFLPEFAVGFISGMFTALGIFFIVVAMLPEKTYNNLAYRKLIAKKND